MTRQHFDSTPTDSDQKQKVEATFGHIEKVDSNRSGEDAEQAEVLFSDDLTQEEETRLLRRIDLKILPLVTGKMGEHRFQEEQMKLTIGIHSSPIPAVLLGSHKHRPSQYCRCVLSSLRLNIAHSTHHFV